METIVVSYDEFEKSLMVVKDVWDKDFIVSSIYSFGMNGYREDTYLKGREFSNVAQNLYKIYVCEVNLINQTARKEKIEQKFIRNYKKAIRKNKETAIQKLMPMMNKLIKSNKHTLYSVKQDFYSLKNKIIERYGKPIQLHKFYFNEEFKQYSCGIEFNVLGVSLHNNFYADENNTLEIENTFSVDKENAINMFNKAAEIKPTGDNFDLDKFENKYFFKFIEKKHKYSDAFIMDFISILAE